jgi:hypothetical protein
MRTWSFERAESGSSEAAMDERERARAAKEKVREIVAAVPEVNGIGITIIEGKYTVKVNVTREPAAAASIPREVDGIPVIVRVVGRITRQAEE